MGYDEFVTLFIFSYALLIVFFRTRGGESSILDHIVATLISSHDFQGIFLNCVKDLSDTPRPRYVMEFKVSKYKLFVYACIQKHLSIGKVHIF